LLPIKKEKCQSLFSDRALQNAPFLQLPRGVTMAYSAPSGCELGHILANIAEL